MVYGFRASLLHSKPACALHLPSDIISNQKPNTSGMKGLLVLLGPV